MICRPPHARRRDGFTLIEMLLAIVLIGGLMTALSFHIFALSNIWLSSNDDQFFDQHVEGVSVFLNTVLARSEAIAATETDEAALPVAWARPPGWSEIRDPLLMFRQAETPALFTSEGRPLPDITAYLLFERGAGLSVLWYSALELDIERESDLHKAPISPFVTQIEYAYYERDENRWELVTEPLEESPGQFRLPHYLKLTFEHPDADEPAVRFILVPQRGADMPLF